MSWVRDEWKIDLLMVVLKKIIELENDVENFRKNK